MSEHAQTPTGQLLARGRKLDLVDGSTVTLRFTAYALAVLEDEYGLDSINELFGTQGDEKKGGKVRLIGELLALGVIDRELTGTQFLRLLPLEAMDDAIEALKVALDEALPKANRAQRREAEKTARHASPGTASSSFGAPSYTNPAPSSGH